VVQGWLAQTEANWMEADGWMEAIVMNESDDVVYGRGLCCMN